MQRYLTKYASFLAVSYQTFTNELCQLCSNWIEVHEMFTFTRYRGTYRSDPDQSTGLMLDVSYDADLQGYAFWGFC